MSIGRRVYWGLIGLLLGCLLCVGGCAKVIGSIIVKPMSLIGVSSAYLNEAKKIDATKCATEKIVSAEEMLEMAQYDLEHLHIKRSEKKAMQAIDLAGNAIAAALKCNPPAPDAGEQPDNE